MFELLSPQTLDPAWHNSREAHVLQQRSDTAKNKNKYEKFLEKETGDLTGNKS